jgi:hypothetical protein
MRIDNMLQSLRLLARADAMIAEASVRARLSRIGLQVVALCVAVFGLVMTGIAAFFALRDLWGTIWAALAVGLGSLAVSLLLLLVSSRRRPSGELQTAREMHRMALDSFVDEVRATDNDFALVRAILRSAADGTLSSIAASLADFLRRALKRSGGEDNPRQE